MLRTMVLILVSLFVLVTHSIAKENSKMDTSNKIVIAHRGASGYLPEHTLESKAMAYAMGAHYIEQDVVMTKDNHIVVLHDPFLDRISNVMEQYPERHRLVNGQKRWLALDFTLTEIKGLKASEGFKLDEQNNKLSNYPERFPLFKSSFSIPTLAEEIELIQGLNHSTGKEVGIYIEIKAPWLHQMEGRDISKAVLELVKSYGYTSPEDKIFIQCFDPDETKRISTVLYPELGIQLPLIQLIAHTDWHETLRVVDGKMTAYNYDWMFEPGAMIKVAEYADGIGPWYPMLLNKDASADNLMPSLLLKEAKEARLQIHPFTFRKDEGQIPAYAKDFNDYLDIFYRQLDVDGVFTDFPDLAVKYLQDHQSR